MKLKIGDVVEFKKYEDMNKNETMCIAGKYFPKSGKIAEIRSDGSFFIEHSKYIFNPESVARVIGDGVDINSLNPGDEVLMKVKIGEIKGNRIWNAWTDETDVVKVLKRKAPEQFIVKEDYYGMYIGSALELVIDKSKAKIYTSRDTAVEDAAEVFPYDTWEVIPYDD